MQKLERESTAILWFFLQACSCCKSGDNDRTTLAQLFHLFQQPPSNYVLENGQQPVYSATQAVVGQARQGETCNRCRVERSLLWEITGSLAAAGNDSRVGKQFLFSKPKIVVKQTVFNRAHTKDPRPTSSIQR